MFNCAIPQTANLMNCVGDSDNNRPVRKLRQLIQHIPIHSDLSKSSKPIVTHTKQINYNDIHKPKTSHRKTNKLGEVTILLIIAWIRSGRWA